MNCQGESNCSKSFSANRRVPPQVCANERSANYPEFWRICSSVCGRADLSHAAFDRDRPECPGRRAQRLVPGRGRRGSHPSYRHRVLGDGQHVRRALCPTIPTRRPIVGEPAKPLRGGIACPRASSETLPAKHHFYQVGLEPPLQQMSGTLMSATGFSSLGEKRLQDCQRTIVDNLQAMP